MKRFDLKYEVQDINSCIHCKHVRVKGEHYYCSIMEAKDNNVEPFGICNSFKDWRK